MNDREVVTAHDGLTGRTGTPCSYCDSPDHVFADCAEAEAFSRGEVGNGPERPDWSYQG